MPVRPLLEAEAFGPDEVKVLVSAFEASLKALRLVDRKDPAVLMVAKRVIALAKAGNLDALALRDEVVETFKNNPPRKPRGHLRWGCRAGCSSPKKQDGGFAPLSLDDRGPSTTPCKDTASLKDAPRCRALFRRQDD